MDFGRGNIGKTSLVRSSTMPAPPMGRTLAMAVFAASILRAATLNADKRRPAPWLRKTTRTVLAPQRQELNDPFKSDGLLPREKLARSDAWLHNQSLLAVNRAALQL